ncbi:hypothetical protein [Peribacillus sp. TH14]|uniref:hypothetical protein n=1 Tax=Peribacillus sp. TH14 TaxID=2798481 RepID=UPI001A917DA6|nr:hypothetical protein [Peribacillus sp. TH14]
MKQTSLQENLNWLGEVCLKNLFIQRFFVSILIIVLGIIQITLDKSVGFDFGYFILFLGGIILVSSTISYIKSRKNKSLEKELAKEYDERDALIDGKVARFSLQILIYEIFILMFLTNFVVIATKTVLFVVLLSLIISEFWARKYYNHVL